MRTKKHKNKTIKLTNILVNPENPRFEAVSGQNEALNYMLETVGEKLVNLAKDMIKDGLNPADPIQVAPDERNESKYITLEGNRRITALKLMNAPMLISEELGAFRTKFQKLNKEFREDPIEEIDCVVYEIADTANKWIELKHTGENGGVGTVPWNAQQKDRFDERVKGRASYGLQVIDFLNESDAFDSTLKDELPKIPISSLNRLLGDPAVRTAIGLKLNNGVLTSDLEEQEVIKGMTKITKDLLDEEFNVKQIYYKTDREDYLNTFETADMANHDNVSENKWDLAISKNNDKKPETQPAQDRKQPNKRDAPLSTDRKTLIPYNVKLNISEPRINKIYKELKKINVNEYENACAVLFRVFIELSMDAFVANRNIQGVGQMSKLKLKVEKVTEELKNKRIITETHITKGIQTTCENENSLFSINTFNTYVHNKRYSPSAKDLKTTWDNIQEFIVAVWENFK